MNKPDWTVRIIAAPPGEAPLWVRQKWVGLDLPVARYSGHGTHLGDTLLGLPHTGLKVQFSEIDIVRFKGDKISEWWHHEDVYLLVNQIQAAVAAH